MTFPRPHLHSVLPKPAELKEEHFWMFGAYSVGGAFTHSTIGMFTIAFSYLAVFIFCTIDRRKMGQS